MIHMVFITWNKVAHVDGRESTSNRKGTLNFGENNREEAGHGAENRGDNNVPSNINQC